MSVAIPAEQGTCLAGASNALELEAAQAPHLYGYLSHRERFSSCKGLIPHQACSASATCSTNSNRDSSHLPSLMLQYALEMLC